MISICRNSVRLEKGLFELFEKGDYLKLNVGCRGVVNINITLTILIYKLSVYVETVFGLKKTPARTVRKRRLSQTECRVS